MELMVSGRIYLSLVGSCKGSKPHQHRPQVPLFAPPSSGQRSALSLPGQTLTTPAGSKARLVSPSPTGCLQVFLLPKQKPDEVLKKLWGNLHAAMKEGDHQAEQALQSLRLIAAGGDGTISWILQAVRWGQLQRRGPQHKQACDFYRNVCLASSGCPGKALYWVQYQLQQSSGAPHSTH